MILFLSRPKRKRNHWHMHTFWDAVPLNNSICFLCLSLFSDFCRIFRSISRLVLVFFAPNGKNKHKSWGNAWPVPTFWDATSSNGKKACSFFVIFVCMLRHCFCDFCYFCVFDTNPKKAMTNHRHMHTFSNRKSSERLNVHNGTTFLHFSISGAKTKNKTGPA